MRQVVELAMFTDRIEAMTRFYARVLDAQPAMASRDMAIFVSGNMKILIHRKVTPRDNEPAAVDHFAIGVRGVDQVTRQLRSAGDVEIDMPPHDYDWGRSAYLRDPDGRLVELHEMEDEGG